MDLMDTTAQAGSAPGIIGQGTPVLTRQTIGPDRIREWMTVLRRYKAGKAATEGRIIASENWWKLRNTAEEQKEGRIGMDGGMVSRSAWLHNVIVSKHADAMESFPEPVILPREEMDQDEARTLSSIIPCILERNHFEEVYSDAAWQKGKTGTGVYKVVWDPTALNGLGDIAVSQVNLLNLYWEPGKTNIQDSRYFFQAELVDRDVLFEQYPQLKDTLRGGREVENQKFLYDDHVDTSNMVTVIEVYYHKYAGGKRVLHYCKFVGDQVLYATEDQPDMAQRGLYDHGLFPYVFDPLYPIEGSPCGYGYVDVCRNPQMMIDTLKTAYVKNAMVGAIPRYFIRGDGGINEDEFLDLANPLVHVQTASEDALRRVEHTGLDGAYMNVLEATIQELRETSGNTETSTGTSQSGVTAASAIAALQEASGKGIRDSNRGSYRAYGRIVELVIELIRQFYDLPRQFRITGDLGQQQFVSYSNAGLQPQHQGVDFGVDMGLRLPVFDIQVKAQRRNAYSTVAQNELALQLYAQGIFNPQMYQQAILCLDMMEFEGKEAVKRKVSEAGVQYQQLQLLQMQVMASQAAQGGQPELEGGEDSRASDARARSAQASAGR